MDAVASCVLFIAGRPSKKDYRRFRIKEVEGSDDYAMLQEAVRRYLSSDQPCPQLLLIDGGPGQLGVVKDEVDAFEDGPEVVSLAKREEEVYLTSRRKPLILPESSEVLQLLQRIRDEAHRFALNYHRQLRSRRLTHSMLDEIRGVGPKRRQALLRHFKSLDAIRRASKEELAEVEGISTAMADRIRSFLEERTRAF